MLIYTIPPEMRYVASVKLSGAFYKLEVCSAIDDIDLAEEVEELSRYIKSVFSRSLDSVLTSRLLNIEPDTNTFTDTVITRNGIKANWNKLQDFFSAIEADPESKLDLILMQAYDASYDALIDSDKWLSILEEFLYAFAEESLKELDELTAHVDETMPELPQYVDQHKIEFASFHSGLILFR